MEKTLSQSRWSRRRSSASPPSPTRAKGKRQYYLRMGEKFNAKEERRPRLTLEKGCRLRHRAASA